MGVVPLLEFAPLTPTADVRVPRLMSESSRTSAPLSNVMDEPNPSDPSTPPMTVRRTVSVMPPKWMPAHTVSSIPLPVVSDPAPSVSTTPTPTAPTPTTSKPDEADPAQPRALNLVLGLHRYIAFSSRSLQLRMASTRPGALRVQILRGRTVVGTRHMRVVAGRSTKTITRMPSVAGNYTLRVTVTTDDGVTDTDTARVVVRAVRPR